MTVIQPNSIAGITSITALTDTINLYKSDGTAAGLNLNGVNLSNTSGVSTFSSLVVTNINSSGVATFTQSNPTNLNVSGVGTVNNLRATNLNVSGITTTNTIELGGTTDTTLSRSAAGVLAVEGVDVVTTSGTQTLTNKTITATQLSGTIAAARLPAGSILQVVQNDYQSEVSTTSTAYSELTGLATNITLSSSSNKVLFCGSFFAGSDSVTGFSIRIIRNSTVISRDPFKWYYIPSNDGGTTLSWMYLDTPGTTSLTYKVEWKVDNSGYAAYINRTNSAKTIERGSSQIILMEVAG